MRIHVPLLGLMSPLLVAVLGCGPAATSAQPCPGLAVGVTKLKVRPAVAGTVGGLPAVRAGGLVKVAATLSNTGATELRHVTLRLQLPDYLVPKHTSTWPPLKQSPNLPLVEDARDLYWTDLTLAPGRSRRVRITALVPGCQNTSTTTPPLVIQTSAYLVANNNVTCLTEASPATFRVRPARKQKQPAPSVACTTASTRAPTTAPSVGPFAVSFGCTYCIGIGIAVDASGNSYTTGDFEGTMTVGSTTLTAVGDADMFMIKLDSSGSPVWAKSFGGSDAESGWDIAVDASGNSYTTGGFEGTMTVGSTTLTAVGDRDIFMIKLDSSGSPVWAQGFGSPSSRSSGNGIDVDASGNSYTTGNFRGTMTVGSIILTAVGGGDIYMIKLDSSGSPVWAKSFGGSGSDIGRGIAVDASGNSYTTGFFEGTMTVGSTTLTAIGTQDIFMIKLDSSGSPVWAKSFGGSGGSDNDSGSGIAVDTSGNCYTTGFFAGTMTVGSTTLTAVGAQDIFMIKLDSSGSPVWAQGFGSPSFRTSGNGIDVDASGNSYTTGGFEGTMTVGSTTLTAVGGGDIYMIKLDSSGSPVWAKGFGGSDNDGGSGIAVDASGNSYTTGEFKGTMTVGSTNLTAVGDVATFVIKLDSSGSPAS